MKIIICHSVLVLIFIFCFSVLHFNFFGVLISVYLAVFSFPLPFILWHLASDLIENKVNMK